MIKTQDSLQFLKEREEYEFDIMYSDPPYALGSEVIIRADGKVDYKKANDFMSKWEMPTGEYWEQWFKEAYRTLKHGGYCIMFGMDRQLLLFKYYAKMAGFEEHQSLYWYFISNFPKATDLSKMIDKNAGVEPIGSEKVDFGLGNSEKGWNNVNQKLIMPELQTDLAKKYDGYKYSISPLKQTNETIMIFHKPYKTGSCLHDTLAYENGDETTTCGALNIDGNRVGTESRTQFSGRSNGNSNAMLDVPQTNPHWETVEGRYPSQTFCNDLTAEVLDRQSGITKTGGGIKKQNTNSANDIFSINKINGSNWEKSEGGCSKILHKCNFEQGDHDLYFYQPKVSKSERNAGCEEMEEKETSTGLATEGRNLEREDGTKTLVDRFVKQPQKNNHPTLKPIELNNKILSLFKTPNEQKICYPFAGSGSEVIGGLKAGFTNYVGCELSAEYTEIALARIKHWANEFDKESKKEKIDPLF